MARVKTGLLRITKVKWMGVGKFNSDDHIAVTLGKNIIEEKEQPI